MRAIGKGAVLLILCVLVAAGAATAQKYGNKWDPAALERGEYLSEEEYCKLKQEEAMAYCETMADILESHKRELGDIKSEVDREKAEADRVRSQVKNLDNRLATLKKTVASMESEYGPYRGKAFSHTVVKREYLSLIAGYDQIYGDAMKWPRLYRANRGQIEDPNLIYPDQVLKVPHGYPKWHLVVEGEFLSKIANYWEIYDDGREWPRIYEANQDQIRDPDMIHPDQVLDIPR